jgi:hypothetical protein
MTVIEVQRKLFSITLMTDDDFYTPDAPHARVLLGQNADLQTLLSKSRSQDIDDYVVVDVNNLPVIVKHLNTPECWKSICVILQCRPLHHEMPSINIFTEHLDVLDRFPGH